MNFLPDNLPALAVAVIALPVGLLIAKYILWPILRITLVPFVLILINGGDKFLNLFSSSKKNKNENEEISEKSKDFFDKIYEFFENIFIKFFDLLSEKFFILKTIVFLIIPFAIINYYLESLALGVSFKSYNYELVFNSVGAMAGAIIVSIGASIIAKTMGVKFSRSIPVSFFSFLSIGIIHYFI